MVGVPLLAASYFVFSCPCDQLLSCHRGSFLICVGLSVASYLWVATH